MTRARYPDDEGFVERDGVKLFYEIYTRGAAAPPDPRAQGDGEDTILLLPTWSIIHSRHWKAQIPYLSRHFRVVTFDGRGNGRSDRPRGVEAYIEAEFAADTIAVMDATNTDSAVLVGLSCAALWGTMVAADHPERVEAIAYIGPAVPLAPGHPERQVSFEDELDTDEGWAKYNRHYWLRDYKGFLEYFFAQMFNEPHSTKQIEDCVNWGLETDPETLADTTAALSLCSTQRFADIAARVTCPVLVIHGDQDRIRPYAQGVELAKATGGELVTLEGSGHGPQARDPIKVNLLLREFAEKQRPRKRTWARGRSRRKRALFISSPIGLAATSRSPRSSAISTPTSRSTGWPRTP